MTYIALTAYDVVIQRALTDHERAMEWIANEGPKFPGSRVVRLTPTGGVRTIWRHPEITVNRRSLKRPLALVRSAG